MQVKQWVLRQQKKPIPEVLLSYITFPKYITKTEHMPPEHRFYRDVNEKDGEYYRRWAAGYGPYTAK